MKHQTSYSEYSLLMHGIKFDSLAKLVHKPDPQILAIGTFLGE